MKTCQETTMDLERSAFQRISWMDRVRIRMHLSICPSCRKYFRDSKAIDKLIHKSFQQPKEYHFSIEEKEAMKKKLT